MDSHRETDWSLTSIWCWTASQDSCLLLTRHEGGWLDSAATGTHTTHVHVETLTNNSAPTDQGKTPNWCMYYTTNDFFYKHKDEYIKRQTLPCGRHREALKVGICMHPCYTDRVHPCGTDRVHTGMGPWSPKPYVRSLFFFSVGNQLPYTQTVQVHTEVHSFTFQQLCGNWLPRQAERNMDHRSTPSWSFTVDLRHHNTWEILSSNQSSVTLTQSNFWIRMPERQITHSARTTTAISVHKPLHRPRSINCQSTNAPARSENGQLPINSILLLMLAQSQPLPLDPAGPP